MGSCPVLNLSVYNHLLSTGPSFTDDAGIQVHFQTTSISDSPDSVCRSARISCNSQLSSALVMLSFVPAVFADDSDDNSVIFVDHWRLSRHHSIYCSRCC